MSISRSLVAALLAVTSGIAVPVRAQPATPVQPGGPPPAVTYPAPGTPAANAWAQPLAPADPDRRSSGEIAELYTTMSIYGAYAGLYVGFAADVDQETREWFGPLTLVGGLGGAMTVFGLDRGPGMRTGVPIAISTGLLLGAGEGLLLWGAFPDAIDSPERAMGTVLASMTAGGAFGTVMGYTLRPTPGDSRLVASAGLWGLWASGIGVLAADPDDGRRPLRGMLGMYNAGIVAGALLTLAVEMDEWRVLVLDAGLAGGGLAGLTITAILAADGSGDASLDPQVAAVSIGIGSAGGLLLTALLTRPRQRTSPAPAAPPVSVYLSPTEGGVELGAHGRF